MKTLIYIIALCFSTPLLSQEKKGDKPPIRPFIIGTELFSPLNIYVEKIIIHHHALKFRYYQMFPKGALGSDKDFAESYMLQYKYYIKKVNAENLNICVGLYSKLRRSTDFYEADIAIRNNQIFGIHGGANYIMKHVVFESSIGIGVSTSYKNDPSLAPFDFRANVGIGYVIY
jgi:hypothetical protein